MGGRIRQQQQIDTSHQNVNVNSTGNSNAMRKQQSGREGLDGDNIEFELPSGAVYRGSFEHGQMHGKGRYDFTNGDAYEGDFLNDRIHGYGVYYYSSGDSYEGYWEAGRRNGKGRYNFANNGGSLIAVWKKDHPNGFGQLYIPELLKPRYEGHWEHSLRHGTGIQRHPNGSYYDGHWERGREEGYGVLQASDGTLYCGEWRAGQRDGHGVLIEHGKKYAVVFNLDYCMSRQPLDPKKVPKSHREVYDYFAGWWERTRGQRIEEGVEEPPRDGSDPTAQFVRRSVYEELLEENKALREQVDRNAEEYVAMEASMSATHDDKMLNTNDPAQLKKSIRMLLDQRDAQRRRAHIAEQRVARSRAAGYEGVADGGGGGAGAGANIGGAAARGGGAGNNSNNNAGSQADRFMGASQYRRPASAIREDEERSAAAVQNLQSQLDKMEQEIKVKESKLRDLEKKGFADQNVIEELQQEVNACRIREQQARQEASNAQRPGASHRSSITPQPRGANDTDEIARLTFELTRAKQELDSTSGQIAELEKKLKHEKEKHRRASRERDEAKQRLAVREMEAALNERLFRLIGAGQMIIIGVLTPGGALSAGEDQRTLVCASPETQYELDCIYRNDQFQDLEDEYANAVTGVRNGYSAAMLFLGSDEASRGTLVSNVLPNALNVLFSAVQQMQTLYEVSVSMSFIEIHRQNIVDLFGSSSASSGSNNMPVTIMKDARGTIAFEGAAQVPVRSADEAIQKWSSTMDSLGRRTSNKFLVLWVDAVDRASKATFHGKLLLADICASSHSKAQLVESETNHLLSTALTEFASTDAYQHRNEPFLMALNDAIGGPTRSIVLYAAGTERALSPSTQAMLQTLADCREKISNFPLQHFETPHALALQKYVSEKAPREMPPKFFPLQQGAA